MKKIRKCWKFKALDVKSRSPTFIFPPPSVSVTSFCSCRVPSPPPPPFGSKAASVLLLMYLARFKHHSKKWNTVTSTPFLGQNSFLFLFFFFCLALHFDISQHHHSPSPVEDKCVQSLNYKPKYWFCDAPSHYEVFPLLKMCKWNRMGLEL